jgi:MFS family permease
MFSSLIANSLVGAGQWRWIYYMSLILNVLALGGIIFFYRPPPRREHDKSIMHQLLRLDWLGMLLFMAGITLFLLGIFFGAKATTYAWNTPKVLCCMVLACGINYLIVRLSASSFLPSSFSGKSIPRSITKYYRRFCLHMSAASTCSASTCLSPDLSFMPSIHTGQSLHRMYTHDPEITPTLGFSVSNKVPV